VNDAVEQGGEVCGGQSSRPPGVLRRADADARPGVDAVVQREIFAPILYVMEYLTI